MRDIRIVPVTRQGDPRSADDAGHRRRQGARRRSRAPGGVLVVEHTADNNLVTFRFKNAA